MQSAPTVFTVSWTFRRPCNTALESPVFESATLADACAKKDFSSATTSRPGVTSRMCSSGASWTAFTTKETVPVQSGASCNASNTLVFHHNGEASTAESGVAPAQVVTTLADKTRQEGGLDAATANKLGSTLEPPLAAVSHPLIPGLCSVPTSRPPLGLLSSGAPLTTVGRVYPSAQRVPIENPTALTLKISSRPAPGP